MAVSKRERPVSAQAVYVLAPEPVLHNGPLGRHLDCGESAEAHEVA